MPEIQWETLGGRLIEARTRLGLTRRKAALAAGYSSASVLGRYERNDVSVPREDIVSRFADLYGVNTLWLMYDRGEPGWSTNGNG
jgi:transcriptional regulator with XRE-family HTH domain